MQHSKLFEVFQKSPEFQKFMAAEEARQTAAATAARLEALKKLEELEAIENIARSDFDGAEKKYKDQVARNEVALKPLFEKLFYAQQALNAARSKINPFHAELMRLGDGTLTGALMALHGIKDSAARRVDNLKSALNHTFTDEDGNFRFRPVHPGTKGRLDDAAKHLEIVLDAESTLCALLRSKTPPHEIQRQVDEQMQAVRTSLKAASKPIAEGNS